MRCTQILGLTDEAERFLSDYGKHGDGKCHCCGQPVKAVLQKREYSSARHLGMFDDGPLLMEYDLKDGRVAREVVQADLWSSGPCIFLCLEIDGKREFEWPESEIRAA